MHILTANRRVFGILFLSVALLAAILVRSYQWDAWGLNYDETATVTKVFRLDAIQLLGDYVLLQNMTTEGPLTIPELADDIFHSFPLYFITAKLWLSHLRPPTWESLREFSLLWAVLTVPIIGAIALRFGRWPAILSVLFSLVHPMLHFMGTYIRFYSLFIFVSAVSYALAVWLFPWLTQNDRKNSPITFPRLFTVLMLSLATIAPSTVHLGGAVASFSIFLIGILCLRRTRLGYVYYVATILIGLVPAAKAAFFLYVRAIDPGQATNIMSTSALHVLLSIGFNFGPGLLLAAMAGSVNILRSPVSHGMPVSERDPKYFTIGFLATLIPIIGLILLKHSIFRPDYASCLLPAVIVLASLFLTRAIQGMHTHVDRIVTGGALFLLVIASILPAFISNAFIDGDRVDYREAAMTISNLTNGSRAVVLSGAPGTFKRSTREWPHLVHMHFKDFHRRAHATAIPVFQIVRELKGYSTKRYPELSTLNGSVRAVLGKDRLDHRICRLYVVEMTGP